MRPGELEGLLLIPFLEESLRIEGIHRAPSGLELSALRIFLRQDLSLDSVLNLQEVFAPWKPIRDRAGMDVRVGSHVTPAGGPAIRDALAAVLAGPRDPYVRHQAFEHLHPFMDGNGRAGRAVWLHDMLRLGRWPDGLSFLHRWYYQSLAAGDLQHGSR